MLQKRFGLHNIFAVTMHQNAVIHFLSDCGFKFYPSWLKAIPLMLQTAGVPLIFTEFTQQVSS
jgi:hypothetical protein